MGRPTQLLIEKGANINEKNKDGQTLLHLAAENGRFEIVQLLIEKGANLTEKTNKGQTALGVLKRSKNISGNDRKKCKEILHSAGLKK